MGFEMLPKYEFKTQFPTWYLIYGILVVILAFIYIIVKENLGNNIDPSKLMLYIIVCIFLLYNLLQVPTSQLKGFDDYLIISGRGWQFFYKIPYKDIINIQPVNVAPFKEYWFFPLLMINSAYGWKPGSKWKGWIPSYFNFFTDKAVAIETSGEKFLISCKDPDKAVKELENIIGSVR
jgi:hypothetical protein